MRSQRYEIIALLSRGGVRGWFCEKSIVIAISTNDKNRNARNDNVVENHGQRQESYFKSGERVIPYPAINKRFGGIDFGFSN